MTDEPKSESNEAIDLLATTLKGEEGEFLEPIRQVLINLQKPGVFEKAYLAQCAAFVRKACEEELHVKQLKTAIKAGEKFDAVLAGLEDDLPVPVKSARAALGSFAIAAEEQMRLFGGHPDQANRSTPVRKRLAVAMARAEKVDGIPYLSNGMVAKLFDIDPGQLRTWLREAE